MVHPTEEVHILRLTYLINFLNLTWIFYIVNDTPTASVSSERHHLGIAALHLAYDYSCKPFEWEYTQELTSHLLVAL